MIDATEFTTFGIKVNYTTGYSISKAVMFDFERGGYIEDETAGRIFCKVLFIEMMDNFGNWYKQEGLISIPEQITENGTSVKARKIDILWKE